VLIGLRALTSASHWGWWVNITGLNQLLDANHGVPTDYWTKSNVNCVDWVQVMKGLSKARTSEQLLTLVVDVKTVTFLYICIIWSYTWESTSHTTMLQDLHSVYTTSLTCWLSWRWSSILAQRYLLKNDTFCQQWQLLWKAIKRQLQRRTRRVHPWYPSVTLRKRSFRVLKRQLMAMCKPSRDQ
jgi:hypothetical protein